MSFAKYSLKDAKHQLSPFNLGDGRGQEVQWTLSRSECSRSLIRSISCSPQTVQEQLVFEDNSAANAVLGGNLSIPKAD